MISQETVPRMLVAAKVAATFVQRREDVAVILLGDTGEPEILVGVDYWANPSAARSFEQTAARKAHARGLRAALMVLPLVTTTTEEGITFRPLGDGVRQQDEVALLWFFTCDLDTGFDLARSQLTWDVDGNAHFQDLEVLKGAAQLVPHSPGFALMQALLADPHDTEAP